MNQFAFIMQNLLLTPTLEIIHNVTSVWRNLVSPRNSSSVFSVFLVLIFCCCFFASFPASVHRYSYIFIELMSLINRLLLFSFALWKEGPGACVNW